MSAATIGRRTAKETSHEVPLLLKHYGGGGSPTPAINCAPMDTWTPEEVDAHMKFMRDFAVRLVGTGEFVDGQAVSMYGAFVRYDGEDKPPLVDGPSQTPTTRCVRSWRPIPSGSPSRLRWSF